jgi:deoxyribonuclease V
MEFKISHPLNLNPQDAKKLQEKLEKRVSLKNGFKEIETICGVDVAFNETHAYAAAVVLSYPNLEVIEEKSSETILNYPYVPGLLAFREGPAIISCLDKLKNEPDLLMLDGQGIAHPRGLGIASHIGVIFGKPAIGCAKSKFIGQYEEPNKKRGEFSFLFNGNKKIGIVLRTRTDVKPVFVSPGHLIDLQTSAKIVLTSSTKYRIPEPLRIADKKSRELARYG